MNPRPEDMTQNVCNHTFRRELRAFIRKLARGYGGVTTESYSPNVSRSFKEIASLRSQRRQGSS
jgi:hypothetical protein